MAPLWECFWLCCQLKQHWQRQQHPNMAADFGIQQWFVFTQQSLSGKWVSLNSNSCLSLCRSCFSSSSTDYHAGGGDIG
ncbi:hypothetical protein E2542_SST19070 [Spatholobus suberectus]|nr:hypothetical protein E2542_SST19070 [Spatholobus suberectus]